MDFLLHYEKHIVHPNADWMVLVHGAGGSTRTWKNQTGDFSQRFNLLVLDLRDHGKSKFRDLIADLEYSIESIALDVVRVLEHLEIKKCHFMGVSLGSVIIRAIEELRPDLIRSVILAGGIFRINIKLNMLLKSGVVLAKMMPFHTLYTLFAHIVLPRNNHKNSRSIFIREAQKITQEEFYNWLSLTKDINKTLKRLFAKKIDVPYLLVMGEQDHVFLKPAFEFASKYTNVVIEIIAKCGHVCNIEKAQEFNDRALLFLEKKFPQPK